MMRTHYRFRNVPCEPLNDIHVDYARIYLLRCPNILMNTQGVKDSFQGSGTFESMTSHGIIIIEGLLPLKRGVETSYRRSRYFHRSLIFGAKLSDKN